ncbi:MAG: PQQ-binding-like beta-propeller repeat protein [Lentisphaeria bacterium]|nr:PQQ-binding-like beta-propeller repeat protein [Lentisphaeria bacterium]
MRIRCLTCPAATLAAALLAARAMLCWQSVPLRCRTTARVPEEAAAGPAIIDPTDHCNRVVAEFERSSPNPEPGLFPSPWPGFRGPHRNNRVPTPVALAETWPTEGPPRLWQTTLGDGHAGPAVFEGAVYVLDYDEERRRDVLRCLSLADGREAWRQSYPVQIKRNHGMSRTVPAVTPDAVVSIGPKCHVMCVDRLTGAFRWGLDLVRDYGATVPLWYTAQCPLVDGDLVILAPAGRDLLLAVDCRSGQVVWRTPNPDGWQMSHSSVVEMVFDGQRAFVYAALGGMVAVAADGPEAGSVLWQTRAWNHRVVAPCPVQIGGETIFMTSGHGAGSMILRLTKESGGWEVTSTRTIDKTVFASEQQTPLWVEGLLYAVLPKDAGTRREELVCLDPGGSEDVLWGSGREHRFGLGPCVWVGDRLFLLDDHGTLSMLAVNREGFRLLARATVLPDGRDAWGPPAFVDGLLLVRDSTRLVCLDLRQDRT